MINETNTCLENVSNNNKDQLKLRDFNDLKKEDVITTVQRVVASKSADDVEMFINSSAEADQLHYTLSKDEAKKIESKYKDKDSQEYASITDELEETLRANLEDQIEVYNDEEVETEIEEISVDQLARRKFAFHSTRDLADQLIDHSEVDENNKNKVLNDLQLDKDKHAVELVLKDNVKTFVIVKNIVKKEKTVVEKTVKKESVSDKNILNEIKETRDCLNSSFSETFDFHKKLDDLMLELYDDERSMYHSLKVFFDRFYSELYFDSDQHLHMQQEDLIKDLRKLFDSLKS